MELMISLEGQNCTANGLSSILFETSEKLKVFFAKNENSLKYGSEFDSIAIIPTCVDDEMWNALGWKERIYLQRKKREADIRLRMDYQKFINSDMDSKRRMFIEVIVASIRAIQDRSKGDFNGELLIKDVCMALRRPIGQEETTATD